MSTLMAGMANTIERSNGLESLTRPLLELLQGMTGLESTYLTRIDEAAAQQRICYSHNAGALDIEEGLEVAWDDTLCRRALSDGTCYSNDVPRRWSDSSAAKSLGITTYVTSAIRDSDGRLLGTLCAASRESRSIPPEAFDVLKVFGKLIGQQIERELLVHQLRRANEALSSQASIDPLTRLPNRRALRESLEQRLREAVLHGRRLVIGFVDLDGFKAINDTHGHVAGDRFLHLMGERLAGCMRPGDVVGRYGGDEFLALFEAGFNDDAAAVHLRDRLEAITRHRFDLGSKVIDYDGASVGVAIGALGETDADALIARADAAMYERKQVRRSGA